jgi:small subunit ribosomal protein S14
MANRGKNEGRAAAKAKFGRGANKCQMCGRKQGLVRRYNIMLCRQCFREYAAKIGFKKMN